MLNFSFHSHQNTAYLACAMEGLNNSIRVHITNSIESDMRHLVHQRLHDCQPAYILPTAVAFSTVLFARPLYAVDFAAFVSLPPPLT